MTVSAYLRHPLLLLAAVSGAIGFIWYVLGLPVQLPPSPLSPGEKLACVAYAPERIVSGAQPAPVAPTRIDADLAALAPHTNCIRTYRTGAGLDRVPEIAARHGLTVLMGVALGADRAENEAEIDRAVAAADAQRGAIRALVAGDLVLTRRRLRPSELTAIVRQLREETKLPVTSAELADTWLNADLLAAAADFLLLHAPLYDADFPIAAADAAAHVTAARAKLVAEFPRKDVMVETGWPSMGRMREAALPSPANQARVLHALQAAAGRGRFQLVIFEGIDNPGRAAAMGTAAAHWGLLQAGSGGMKFRWGGTVVNHPLWFIQGTTGVLLAFVIFAAGFLAARSAGPGGTAAANWGAVSVIALGGGAFTGWAVADLAMQAHSPGRWVFGTALLLIAVAVPPICAAAVIRGAPFEGFGAILDRSARRAALPLSRTAAAALVATIFMAIPLGLILTFDPEGRDFPFAAMTGPAIALIVLAMANPRGQWRDSVAEKAAALVLAASAALIVINESFWNWQALWLAAALLGLAFACWRVRTAQMP